MERHLGSYHLKTKQVDAFSYLGFSLSVQWGQHSHPAFLVCVREKDVVENLSVL